MFKDLEDEGWKMLVMAFSAALLIAGLNTMHKKRMWQRTIAKASWGAKVLSAGDWRVVRLDLIRTHPGHKLEATAREILLENNQGSRYLLRLAEPESLDASNFFNQLKIGDKIKFQKSQRSIEPGQYSENPELNLLDPERLKTAWRSKPPHANRGRFSFQTALS